MFPVVSILNTVAGLVFPIIKSFLGENVIEKMLAHRQALAASANERERVELEQIPQKLKTFATRICSKLLIWCDSFSAS